MLLLILSKIDISYINAKKAYMYNELFLFFKIKKCYRLRHDSTHDDR